MTHPDRNIDSGDVIHRGVTHRLLWQEHETFGVVSRHPRAILHHAHIVLIPVLPENIKHSYYCTNELNVCLRWGNQINNRWWIRGSSFWHTAVWLLKMNHDIYLRVSADAVHVTNQSGRFKKLKWDDLTDYRRGSRYLLADRACSVYTSALLYFDIPLKGNSIKKTLLLCRNDFSSCIVCSAKSHHWYTAKPCMWLFQKFFWYFYN